jgi:hypothetical protein
VKTVHMKNGAIGSLDPSDVRRVTEVAVYDPRSRHSIFYA